MRHSGQFVEPLLIGFVILVFGGAGLAYSNQGFEIKPSASVQNELGVASDYKAHDTEAGTNTVGSVAADAMGIVEDPSITQSLTGGPPRGPAPPTQTAMREGIDRSLRGIWRETNYEVSNINYISERLSAYGESGQRYEADIAVTMKLPAGWLAECIGPDAPWGCQHVDSNMMQSARDPIPIGGSRTYRGVLTMTRLRADGNWVNRSGEWVEAEPEWESRVSWQR